MKSPRADKGARARPCAWGTLADLSATTAVAAWPMRGGAMGVSLNAGGIAADVADWICGPRTLACFLCELIITLNALVRLSEREAPAALAPVLLV